MKRYVVHDRQGAGFMAWTYEKPQTKHQIKSYLHHLANEGKTDPGDMWDWRTTKLDDYLEMWELELEEAER